MLRCVFVGLLSLVLVAGGASAQNCEPGAVAVQILGSGGPRLDRWRTSTSYLLWVGDQARVLVDMGGGGYGRFGQTQAKLADLSLVAVSHLHPDHISDLPALLWQSNLDRKERLPIVGPSGNDAAPDFPTFLSRLFDEKNGAFPVLGATIGGLRRDIPGRPLPGATVGLDAAAVDVTKTEPATVFDRDGLTVTAQGIPHGNMPTLAYRVKVKDVSIVFSSDQTGTDPKFVDFAKGANLLIMHLALPAGARNNPLHAAPEVVGRVAQQANVGRLLISHIACSILMPHCPSSRPPTREP